jgi:hypothetical protein
MTTYFDLAYAAPEGNFRSFKSAFRLAMSAENAQRMLGILGQEQGCQIFQPAQLDALLDRTGQELQSRAAQDDSRSRYEVPRLVQLHCLFTAARRKGCAVTVWRDEVEQGGSASGLGKKRDAA